MLILTTGMLLRVTCVPDQPDSSGAESLSPQTAILTEYDVADLPVHATRLWDDDSYIDLYYFILNSDGLHFRDAHWRTAPSMPIECAPLLVHWYKRLTVVTDHDGHHVVFHISGSRDTIVVTDGLIEYGSFKLGYRLCETITVTPCIPFKLRLTRSFNDTYTYVQFGDITGRHSAHCLRYIVALSLAQDSRFTY